MKKFITKIILTATAILSGFFYCVSPVYAYAEEPVIVEEVSAETSEAEASDVHENDVNTSSSVVHENDVNTSSSVVEGSSEESVEEGKESENNEDLGHTFEDFLAWVEQEADRYGYGDEYAAALETIRTAASEGQVTLSTISSFLLMAAIIAYTIYKKVTDKKFKDDVSALSSALSSQFNKLNELVDGTNSNTKTEEEIRAEEQALKDETKKVKDALENLINGFMHFTSHVSMKDEHKAEVQRDCSKALKSIDGEVKTDENHKE